MDLEPVLLETSLRAILDRLPLALGTTIERYELLFGFAAVPLHKSSSLILLGLFQRTLFILALTYMNDHVIWGLWDLLAARGRWVAVQVILQVWSSTIVRVK
jgi:hypothetical protein